jgi:uncharacterized protein DUF4389
MYPVHVEISSPPRFERVQLLLRILFAIVLGWVGITAGWLICVLYGALPVIAAITLSAAGSERWTTEVAPRLWRVLAWLVQLSAFMVMLVDRFPTGEDFPIRVELRATGKPTVGSALARLITSIPSGFVLMILWWVSSVLWLVGAFFVLFGASIPESILAFQRGVLRWQARLVAYHASLVDEYPPFSFDTGHGHDEIVAEAGAR